MYVYDRYPPPRFARRREWELNTKHPSPGPCACPYPSPLPLPLPSSSGVWSVLKNLDLGDRTIHPPGWPRHGLTPPRTFQNQWKNRFFFESFFQCLFGSIFGPFCLPTCLPKSIEMFQKSMPRCIPSWTPCLDRFLVDFCSQLGPPEPNLALAG